MTAAEPSAVRTGSARAPRRRSRWRTTIGASVKVSEGERLRFSMRWAHGDGGQLGNYPQAHSHASLITAAYEIDKAKGLGA